MPPKSHRRRKPPVSHKTRFVEPSTVEGYGAAASTVATPADALENFDTLQLADPLPSSSERLEQSSRHVPGRIGGLGDAKREEVAKVRADHACWKCRITRVRCTAMDKIETGARCDTCTVRKATVWENVPCCRESLTKRALDIINDTGIVRLEAAEPPKTLGDLYNALRASYWLFWPCPLQNIDCIADADVQSSEACLEHLRNEHKIDVYNLELPDGFGVTNEAALDSSYKIPADAETTSSPGSLVRYIVLCEFRSRYTQFRKSEDESYRRKYRQIRLKPLTHKKQLFQRIETLLKDDAVAFSRSFHLYARLEDLFPKLRKSLRVHIKAPAMAAIMLLYNEHLEEVGLAEFPFVATWKYGLQARDPFNDMFCMLLLFIGDCEQQIFKAASDQTGEECCGIMLNLMCFGAWLQVAEMCIGSWKDPERFPGAREALARFISLLEDTVHLFCASGGKGAPETHKGCGKLPQTWKDFEPDCKFTIWGILKLARECSTYRGGTRNRVADVFLQRAQLHEPLGMKDGHLKEDCPVFCAMEREMNLHFIKMARQTVAASEQTIKLPENDEDWALQPQIRIRVVVKQTERTWEKSHISEEPTAPTSETPLGGRS